MKDTDREIQYRPDLAGLLQEALKFANNFYSINFKKAYYLLLSEYYKNSDEELSKLLLNASKCFDSVCGEYTFDECYEDDLKRFNIEILSEARAAYIIFNVYKDYFDKFLKDINLENLSKMEKFMVESFFRKLKAPMNNPNIEIKEGQTKCYYDRDFSSSYSRDLKMSLEYMNKECQSTIDIFCISD